jgi:hypothetical protein
MFALEIHIEQTNNEERKKKKTNFFARTHTNDLIRNLIFLLYFLSLSLMCAVVREYPFLYSFLLPSCRDGKQVLLLSRASSVISI